MPSLDSASPAKKNLGTSLSRPLCPRCAVEMWIAVAPPWRTKGLNWLFQCPVCKTTAQAAEGS
jgi:tRNA(Ile2) C34 agmatinyltransferase TiaS